jgi:repressor
MSSTGQNIRACRKKLAINQKTLATLVDVSFTTVRRWEKNERAPRVDELQRLCEVLGVSEAELLRGPAEEKWVLEIKIADSKEEVIDMTGTMPCVAAITGTQSGANLQLSAKWETFRDDAKFQDFIDQVTRARGLLLEMGAGMEKLKEARA